MKPVVCLGGLTIDEIYHISAFPEIDDARLILESVESYGGRGALVALTLGMLNIPVSLCTGVGSDFGERGYERFLKDNGVNLEGIIRFENEPCYNTKIFVAGRKNTITFVQIGHLHFGEPNEVHYELVNEAGILYFAVNDLEFNLKCLRYASSKKNTIIHNLSSEIICNPGYFPYAMENSDIQILNEVEYKRLRSLVHGDANDILNKYPRLKYFIVTKGEQGSSLYSKNNGGVIETKISPFFDGEGRVPVGLGDMFSSGVVYGISQGWDLEKAANFGSYLGAASFQSDHSFVEKKILEEFKQKFSREYK